jgi:histidine kinase/DNA gyrase B/HSP90-like ATPase
LQPFGQAKPATTRTYGGTGLGLPITKGLVEAHGGSLTILSRPGEGTTVRLVLPIQPPDLLRAPPPGPVPSSPVPPGPLLADSLLSGARSTRSDAVAG